MLVSESGASSSSREVVVQIVSPDGQTFISISREDTLIEELKNQAINFFYPNGETGSNIYKIVRVYDMATMHDFLTLGQAQISSHEELLLVERRGPEAGALWDLGAVRAPPQAAIAAATSFLPQPINNVRQPNLQSLLSTNELSFELRKILISLVEAGARLAAAGRNYENSLNQLSAALDKHERNVQVVEVLSPDQIRARLEENAEEADASRSSDKSSSKNDLFHRAECLQKFLDKFRDWRMKISEPPKEEALNTLQELGFSTEEADSALRNTGCNVPAAASWLIGERGSSIFELINGLPDGTILDTLLKQPQIQRGLLNTRMLIAFITMVQQSGNASLWLNSPHGSPLLSQISRTYHSEKYCLAVNQFSEDQQAQQSQPSTSSGRRRIN